MLNHGPCNLINRCKYGCGAISPGTGSGSGHDWPEWCGRSSRHRNSISRHQKPLQSHKTFLRTSCLCILGISSGFPLCELVEKCTVGVHPHAQKQLHKVCQISYQTTKQVGAKAPFPFLRNDFVYLRPVEVTEKYCSHAASRCGPIPETRSNSLKQEKSPFFWRSA